MLTGVLFQQGIDGNDEGRNELALVGYDSYLVHVLVDQYLRLYHLRSDIFAVRGLEEILDALLQEQLAALQVARVARAEVAVVGKRLACQVLTVVIAPGDGRAFQQHLALFADADANALDGNTHRTHRPRFTQVVARYGG